MAAEARAPGRSLFSRVALVLVAAFAALHIAGFYFYGHERMLTNARTFAEGVAERALQLDNLLAAQPELLPLLQSEGFQINRLATAPAEPEGFGNRWPHNPEIVVAVQERLRRANVDLSQVGVAYVTRPGPARLSLVLPSRSGGFLQILAVTRVTQFGRGSRAGISMTLVLVGVIGLMLYMMRRLTGQLSRFSVAAERLGRGRAGDPLPEGIGPAELRRASVAFNRMQARVVSLLDERSNMLAGVSHDLRTLCTRLGLRIEYIQDSGQREKAQQDILLMTDILDQALTFARDEHTDEAFAQIDISSLLASLVHGLQDQNCDVTYAGPDHMVLAGQRLAVTRLFANIVDNALKYGGRAEVVLTDKAVTIFDPGPGFDPRQTEQALAPYVRLQAARSQNLPGTGLGLAIADNVCRRHGWLLEFEQLADGFEVAVIFA